MKSQERRERVCRALKMRTDDLSGIWKKIRKWEEKLIDRWYLTLIVAWALAFVFLLLMSVTSSLLDPGVFGYDSAYFQAIGKLWARKGILPYRDLFDHKGPLLFFINALAWGAPRPRPTLFLIQWCFCTVTVYFSIRILNRLPFALRVFTVLSGLFFWAGTLYEGNLAEEYSMPFLMLSLFFQLRWLLQKERPKEHEAKYAFLYGLCFGMINLIVVKYALLICTFSLVITADLIKERQWKNLLKNAVMCLAGVILPFIPFAVYFYVKGAFRDLIYATWIYNFKYMEETAAKDIFGGLVQDFRMLIPEFCLLIAGAAKLVKRRFDIGAAAVLTALLQLYFCLNSARYVHYFMLGYPLLIAAFALPDWRAVWEAFGARKKITPESIVCLCLVLLTLIDSVMMFPYVKKRSLPRDPEWDYAIKTYNSQLQEIVNEIPENERDQIGFYNLNVSESALFLVNDIGGTNKDPILTEFHAEVDESIYDRFRGFLEQSSPGWMIVSDTAENEGILEIIKETYEEVYSVKFMYRYTPFGNEDTLRLYRRKR